MYSELESTKKRSYKSGENTEVSRKVSRAGNEKKMVRRKNAEALFLSLVLKCRNYINKKWENNDGYKSRTSWIYYFISFFFFQVKNGVFCVDVV